MSALTPWPAFDPAHPNAFFVGAAKVYNNFRGFGCSNPFSIAMVTMADKEAWFQTGVVGDNGTAFGLWQEHTDRAARIKSDTGIDLLAKPAPGIADQCKAAWHELNTTETKARDAMNAAATASDAAMADTKLFERAGAPSAVEVRGAEGTRWSVFFANNMPWVIAQGV